MYDVGEGRDAGGNLSAVIIFRVFFVVVDRVFFTCSGNRPLVGALALRPTTISTSGSLLDWRWRLLAGGLAGGRAGRQTGGRAGRWASGQVGGRAGGRVIDGWSGNRLAAGNGSSGAGARVWGTRVRELGYGSSGTGVSTARPRPRLRSRWLALSPANVGHVLCMCAIYVRT